MKIFNASRFVSNIVENSGVDINVDYVKNVTNPLDKAWIARMCDAIDVSRKAFENHDYSFALETTEHAFWDFCDNYLEIVKTRAYSDNPTSAVSSLMVTIDLFAKLFAPFLSFITEEIFQARAWGKETGSVHIQPFPSSETYADVKTDADLYRKVVSMVELGRKVKADEKRSLRTPVLTMTVSANQNMIDALKQAQTDIENVLNIKEHKIEFEAHSEDLEITNCVLGEDEPKKPKA